ncbi:TPA: hypothetical protein ACGQK4_002192 [Elizabethkingia anophelis]|nr:hypothetical protein [Elizabethkingia anophelis]
METPKEKAFNLFKKVYYIENDSKFISITKNEAIKCAKICVDEILEQLSKYNPYCKDDVIYWNKVNEELEIFKLKK